MSRARALWMRIETIHAVTYFADESIAAAADAGLRGFWMGYFGFRAAPMGAVSAGVVEAAFANFAPSMVRRAVPDAWSFASPDDLVRVRAQAAADALRRVAPEVDDVAAAVSGRLAQVAARADPIGRPLFAANREVVDPADPVGRLWQLCTTLREHRGDGHVAAVAGAGLDGCEVHRLVAAERAIPDPVFLRSRGWTDDEWSAAGRRLVDRGLLEPDDEAGHGPDRPTGVDGTGHSRWRLTAAGARLRADVEARTDRLAIEPFHDALGPHGIGSLLDASTHLAETIARSGVLPFPNPMALPSVADPVDADGSRSTG